jgi:uncharacterized membrane protein (DUF4010 family)
MDLASTFQHLWIAAGLGLLVGLQRERAASRLAGMRTFPLIALLGTITATLAQTFGGWVIAAGLVALASLIFVGKMGELKDAEADPGLTTEIAMLLMFAVGAYLVVGSTAVAVAIGGGMAALLQFKVQLHGVAARLGDEDLKAIMQFALISLVILPVLPDRTYGPYNVLNPRQIWWMVVLIVGISLGGYIIYKFFGQSAGIVLGGILGGLISSTATTVSYSRRTAGAPEASRLAAVIIMIASTIVFGRLLIEIAFVAPGFLRAAAPPIAIMLALLAGLSIGLLFMGRKEQNEMPEQKNPSELKGALMFGLIYGVVLFAVAAARDLFGDKGLYAVAGISGLTDVDAITLSTSQLVASGNLDAGHGWRLILVAAMSNLVFKAAAIATLGHRELFAKVAPLYGLALAAAVMLLIFWP